MIKLWRRLILPIVEAADSRIILEIGAESGTSTRTLLRYVQQRGGQLHCIDPVPEFDAEALEREFPDQLRFYRDLSLNVLPDLPRVDLAMVDGDHNWYTVYNELKQIEAIHGHDGAVQPIVLVHDIGWPYGRRDLYYNPATIPEEHRHPHERKGILPNRCELVEGTGMNLDLHNADHEGGPRNGVLTGVEDYLAETQLNYRFINLPLYYGLGILVTKERLAANAALRSAIDEVDVPPAALRLLGLTEHLRCVDGIMLQAVHRLYVDAEARLEKLEPQPDPAGKP